MSASLHGQKNQCQSVADADEDKRIREESDVGHEHRRREAWKPPGSDRTQCSKSKPGTEKVASNFIKKIVQFQTITSKDGGGAIDVFDEVRALLMSEQMTNEFGYHMTEVDPNDEADVFVFGDIHGSLFSLVPILRAILHGIGKEQPCKKGEENLNGGACLVIECNPGVHYVFNGDYVDRGDKMLEVALLLFSLKLVCPKHVTLLRGNHETAEINADYGFLELLRNWDGFPPELDFVWPVRRAEDPPAILEHLSDYKMMTTFGKGLHLWYTIQKAFGALPVSARVKGRVWCMHGGPPKGGIPMLKSTKLRPLPKLGNECNPDTTPMCQMMWNDVIEDEADFEFNEIRNTAFMFGGEALEKLLNESELEMIVRGHDYTATVAERGFECQYEDRICTIFSAAQYQTNEVRPTPCGDDCQEEYIVNENPGAIVWLHGPKDIHFKTQKGVKIQGPVKRQPGGNGKTTATVITFDGRTMRHVARSLGCVKCVSHIAAENMKLHVPQYPSGLRSMMNRNNWANKRKQGDAYKDPQKPRAPRRKSQMRGRGSNRRPDKGRGKSRGRGKSNGRKRGRR